VLHYFLLEPIHFHVADGLSNLSIIIFLNISSAATLVKVEIPQYCVAVRLPLEMLLILLLNISKLYLKYRK